MKFEVLMWHWVQVTSSGIPNCWRAAVAIRLMSAERAVQRSVRMISFMDDNLSPFHVQCK